MNNKAEKVKKFFNEHRGEMIVGSVTVGMFVLGYLHSKSQTKLPAVTVEVPELTPFEKSSKMVDEAIFTNLSPWIEDWILSDKLINSMTIHKDFPIEFEGDTRLRRVIVTVEDLGQYLEEEVTND